MRTYGGFVPTTRVLGGRAVEAAERVARYNCDVEMFSEAEQQERGINFHSSDQYYAMLIGESAEFEFVPWSTVFSYTKAPEA